MRKMLRAIALAVGIFNLSILGADTKQQFSLTIKLKAQHPSLTACILVRTAEPFEVVLTNGAVTTAIAGEIRHPTRQGFPVELAVTQGHGESSWAFDRLGYQLKLGVPAERPIVVLTSNHPTLEDREITLADGGCHVY